MIALEDVTFIIPVRIDSVERLENLSFILNYISSCFGSKILVLEADRFNLGLVEQMIPEKCIHLFTEDSDPVFHRTKYLNCLSKHVNTAFVAVWDSDVVLHPSQIELAVSRLREQTHDFVFPYDGNFLDTGAEHRINFMNSGDIDYLLSNRDTMRLPYTSTACGGGFFARMSDYLECGGENENFYGWGQEDGERVKRWQILGKRIIRVKGPIFHLFHPRGLNSGYLSKEHRDAQVAEFYRISSMNQEMLRREIQSWEHFQYH